MKAHPRNAPCHCGSGKKYKKCHLLIEREEAEQAEIAFRERMRQRALEAEQRQKESLSNPAYAHAHTWGRRPPPIMAAIIAGAMLGNIDRR